MIPPLDNEEMELMRKSCRLAAETLLLVGDYIRPGVTTDDINHLCHEYIVSNGGYPSPLHYKGFPKSVCTSRNAIMCHGIPSKDETLLDGDIINVDVTVYFPEKNGFHGDTSATFYVGKPRNETKLVVETARECLNNSLKVVKSGRKISEIGSVIQAHAEAMGCSVAKEFVGHGVGRVFHGEPSIPHFSIEDYTLSFQPGMIFTIEPIINAGTDQCYIMPDCWSIITKDGSLSAQFEHTILVTETGYEILTERERPLKNSEVFE